jgi:hypothetical protein
MIDQRVCIKAHIDNYKLSKIIPLVRYMHFVVSSCSRYMIRSSYILEGADSLYWDERIVLISTYLEYESVIRLVTTRHE